MASKSNLRVVRALSTAEHAASVPELRVGLDANSRAVELRIRAPLALNDTVVVVPFFCIKRIAAQILEAEGQAEEAHITGGATAPLSAN